MEIGVKGDKIRIVWYAEDTGGADFTKNKKLTEATQTTDGPRFQSMGPPTSNSPSGGFPARQIPGGPVRR